MWMWDEKEAYPKLQIFQSKPEYRPCLYRIPIKNGDLNVNYFEGESLFYEWSLNADRGCSMYASARRPAHAEHLNLILGYRNLISFATGSKKNHSSILNLL